jgi:glycosyltransferase involved in cell wall biosynthesis
MSQTEQIVGTLDRKKTAKELAARDGVCDQISEDLPARPISVCLLISSLEYGGAERQVVEMFRSFDRRRVRPVICSLSDKVPLADLLGESRKDLHIVRRRWRFDFTTVFRVAGLLRRERINVVHAFLFDAEIVGRLAAPLAGVRVVIASERNSDYERRTLHNVALRLTQPLVDAVVANSFAGREFTLRTTGLGPSRVKVVHNGVDGARFCPDRDGGQIFRARVGIPHDAVVVGMVGSYKRQKGHDVFLRMATQIAQHRANAFFLIVGGPTGGDLAPSQAYKLEIEKMARTLGINGRCRFLENEPAMGAVYNACDVTVLLSRREGTPNVLLESMACGVPVVASNVADNSFVVRDESVGLIVPVDDANAATIAVEQLLARQVSRSQVCDAARQRACDFSSGNAARRLEQIYATCLLRKTDMQARRRSDLKNDAIRS